MVFHATKVYVQLSVGVVTRHFVRDVKRKCGFSDSALAGDGDYGKCLANAMRRRREYVGQASHQFLAAGEVCDIWR
ncbi:hypothetical protein BL253_28475 [Pseudofrankia asymbiotica]|uniref:Uncharacterized protein n=1 Tax=Pseudofrankia asymbiotica TaxID=1834516 RepID=A0A1V2I430_9ACTN|nr:hypothetical protein BL253_28475 [Pseudofrankia asymbiotica]